MRVHLKIKANNTTIPFDHQHLLVGTIHKWLGWNEAHGKLSMYSFSRLEGGVIFEKELKFNRGTSFFFSSQNIDLVKKILLGIRNEPEMFCEMVVAEVILEEDPDLSNRDLFFAASPIFIKRRVGDKIDHILFNDRRSAACLKETLTTKMNAVGITDNSLDIEFDKNYSKARTQKINYKGVENRVSWCPVLIKGKPETKLFAWNVGLGNSTGIGFGAIK
jgi:CRISPR-associated endoribonuclease Cas6